MLNQQSHPHSLKTRTCHGNTARVYEEALQAFAFMELETPCGKMARQLLQPEVQHHRQKVLCAKMPQGEKRCLRSLHTVFSFAKDIFWMGFISFLWFHLGVSSKCHHVNFGSFATMKGLKWAGWGIINQGDSVGGWENPGPWVRDLVPFQVLCLRGAKMAGKSVSCPLLQFTHFSNSDGSFSCGFLCAWNQGVAPCCTQRKKQYHHSLWKGVLHYFWLSLPVFPAHSAPDASASFLIYNTSQELLPQGLCIGSSLLLDTSISFSLSILKVFAQISSQWGLPPALYLKSQFIPANILHHPSLIYLSA